MDMSLLQLNHMRLWGLKLPHQGDIETHFVEAVDESTCKATTHDREQAVHACQCILFVRKTPAVILARNRIELGEIRLSR